MGVAYAGELTLSSSPNRIINYPVCPLIAVEGGWPVEIDEETAEDLYISAAEGGRGIGWLVFPRFHPQVLPSLNLFSLTCCAAAFPVRLATGCVIPAYLAAQTVEALLDKLPLGLERLVIPFLDIVSSIPFQCWI